MKHVTANSRQAQGINRNRERHLCWNINHFFARPATLLTQYRELSRILHSTYDSARGARLRPLLLNYSTSPPQSSHARLLTDVAGSHEAAFHVPALFIRQTRRERLSKHATLAWIILPILIATQTTPENLCLASKTIFARPVLSQPTLTVPI